MTLVKMAHNTEAVVHCVKTNITIQDIMQEIFDQTDQIASYTYSCHLFQNYEPWASWFDTKPPKH